MREQEIKEYYKMQAVKAQYYLSRYINELQLHFSLDDFYIIKILETQLRVMKIKNRSKNWTKFFKKK